MQNDAMLLDAPAVFAGHRHSQSGGQALQGPALGDPRARGVLEA